MPLFNLDLDYAAWGKRLDDLGLARTAVTVRGDDDNPISPDAAVRAKGVDDNKRTLDCCRARPARPTWSALITRPSATSAAEGRRPDEWKWGVESMRQVAEHAGKVGVTLGVESLNRFECYLLNTHADSARLRSRGGSSQLPHDVRHVPRQHRGEEHPAAIRSCADVLVPRPHFRERPQHARHRATFAGPRTSTRLQSRNYDGWLMIEAFGLALPELAAATKIWRRMFDSEEQLARDGLAFMKAKWRSAGNAAADSWSLAPAPAAERQG